MPVSSARSYLLLWTRFTLAAALLFIPQPGKLSSFSSDSLTPASIPAAPAPGRLPLSFIPNAGQTDPAVRFLTHALGGTVFFTAGEVVLALPSAQSNSRPAEMLVDSDTGLRSNGSPLTATTTPHVIVRLSFVGAGAMAISGMQRLPGIVSYFIGNDPARWRPNLPTYAGLVYHNLYPGIDLQYDGTQGQLKSSYLVAPGADPGRIRWRYTGAAATQVDATTGALRLSLPAAANANSAPVSSRRPQSAILELAPTSWQDIGGRRVAVATRYTLNTDGSVSFVLPRGYDRSQPLTLDPTLQYSSYLGGTDEDNANGVAVDATGNIYVTGLTFSTNFPTPGTPYQGSNHGGADAFVTKLSPDGATLLYSTYLGGTGSTDFGQGIAADSAGNVYVTGLTDSTDFPTSTAPYQGSSGLNIDAFLTKLDPTGANLLYSTYLGGSDNDYGLGIGADPVAGVAYLTGLTYSTDFPLSVTPYQTSNGSGADGFIAKIDTTLTGTASLLYSTYFGGNGDDRGSSIAVDPVTKIAYVTGRTASTNFPTSATPYQGTKGSGLTTDAFVLKLNTTVTGTAALLYSTYLGGRADDRALGIARDTANNVYVTGRTVSHDFPTTLGAFQTSLASGTCLDAGSNPVDCYDGFVAKINPTITGTASLIYSTYLGGNDDDEAFGIAVDSSTGNAFVTGYTNSPDFPTQNAFQPACGWGCGQDFIPGPQIGFVDAFVTELNAAGSALLFSTYLGGSSADLPFGIARAPASGDLYVAGDTLSGDFPTVAPYQSIFEGINTYDVFVSRIAMTTTSANLSVTGVDKPDPVLAGNALSYTLTLHNGGLNTATGVRLVDSLPGGGSASLDHTTATQGSCLLISLALSCDVGTLTNNTTVTITVFVNVAMFASGSITNTASIASNVSDPVGTNNVATQSTTVDGPPVIQTQPQSQIINSGQNVTLTVVATDTLPLSYQWYQGASGDASHPKAGAIGPSYTTPPLTTTTSYWVRVSNPLTSTDSATAVITVNHPPVITAQPMSQTISAGQSVTLTVVATSTLPLRYHWYQGSSGDTANPAGTNAASFNTPPLAATTSYWVRVSNTDGSADSLTATIAVIRRAYLPVLMK